MNIVKLLTLNKKVKKQAGGNVVTVTMPKGNKVLLDGSSKEYADLYNSGKLMNKIGDDSYVAPSIKATEIVTTAPAWLKAKRLAEKRYTKEQFSKDALPPWAGALGENSDNLSEGSQKEYDRRINDKVAKDILYRKPQQGADENSRLRWYNSLSDKEKEIVTSSSFSNLFEPAVRANKVYQSNKAQKDGILSTLSSADKLATATEGTSERFRFFPNAKNNIDIESWINPLVIFGGMGKELGSVPKDVKEENYGKAALSIATPLTAGALGSIGAKTTGQFINNVVNPLAGTGDLFNGIVENVTHHRLVPSLYSTSDLFKGNYKKVLNQGKDIHDVRLKYHNKTSFLNKDEFDLLKKEGKGNPQNYKNVNTTDVLGSTQVTDKSIPKKNISDMPDSYTGKEYDKVNDDTEFVTDIVSSNSSKIKFPKMKKAEIQDLKKSIQTNKILKKETKPTPLFSPKPIIEKPFEKPTPLFSFNIVKPYERTETTRKADKWLSEWYSNPITKKKFIDYGGTEKEWEQVLNSLENPILSNYIWGKNRPAGIYHSGIDKASVPLNATTDAAVHEGIHKTKIVLDDKKPILPKLWNDITEAVEEVPYEVYPELGRLRYNAGLKPGDKLTMEQLDEGLKTINNYYYIPDKIKDKNKLLETINKMPALIPATVGAKLLQQNSQTDKVKNKSGGNLTNRRYKFI